MSTERVTEIAVWSNYTPGPVEEEVMKIVSESEGFLALVSAVIIRRYY